LLSCCSFLFIYYYYYLKPEVYNVVYFRSYHDDPILNPLTPWDRPPIKNIFCIYGIDMKTEVNLHSSYFYIS